MRAHNVAEKTLITERLRREGRWKEAYAFKEQRRIELRYARYGRSEAVEMAWKAMVEKYPPLPEEPAPAAPAKEAAPQMIANENFFPEEEDDGFEFPPDAEQSADQIAADCRWVYRNIARKNVQKKDCPSAGAWGLLSWARKNQAKFYEQIAVKIASGKLGASDTGAGDKGEEDTSELDALLIAAKKTTP